MRELRAVVFDLDNTLLRSRIGARRGLRVAAKIISSQLKKKGLTYSESNLFRRLQWIDREMHTRKFLYNRDVWWKELLDELGVGTRFPWIHRITLQYWMAYADNSPPFRDAEQTVKAVKKMGLKIGLVSDTDGTPGMKRKRIRRVRFHGLFEAVVVSGEDSPRVKPGHESFRLIAKRLHVKPESCVYVADNPRTDITGAKAVGMVSIIVKRRGNQGGSPDYRIPNLAALPGLIRHIQRNL
ncbi:MAG TPA: HAD-IA family hydrolase, partial [Candidatus Bathyarchaeia archaeon]|nr:HAD-IA family hydrolase [Candidatus Bathyarchaeia archaeon]